MHTRVPFDSVDPLGSRRLPASAITCICTCCTRVTRARLRYIRLAAVDQCDFVTASPRCYLVPTRSQILTETGEDAETFTVHVFRSTNIAMQRITHLRNRPHANISPESSIWSDASDTRHLTVVAWPPTLAAAGRPRRGVWSKKRTIPS